MSAVEALAEVLRGHQREIGFPWPQCSCGAWDFSTIEDHQAFVLAPAIRSMPAEQVAELIGGTVCYGHGHAFPFIRSTGVNRMVPEGTNEFCRVVTPWLPLGVSPETNGEQK